MSILKNIFSITEEKSYNKCYNVITLFGLKLKYKNIKKSKIIEEEYNSSINYDIKLNSAVFDNSDKSLYKKNVILYKYHYQESPNNHGVNLGDYVQTIATKNVINKILPNIEYKFWDRDNLLNYDGQPAFVVMQGWFGYGVKFLPNEKILPILIGTHITTTKRDGFCKVLENNADYFKKVTFGCRDTSTLNFIRRLNLESYLSRCLTLTFPKREDNKLYNKTFIVDIAPKFHKYIPKSIRKNAEYIYQRSVDADKKIEYFVSEEEYIKQTEDLLRKYKDTAKLVITSALHCASPCIAMGIPTVLIDFEDKNDRFGSLDGIIKIYNKEDLVKGKIDFNPKSIDIEDLKQLLIKNVDLSIKQAFDEEVDIDELKSVRQKIENYSL